MALGHCTKSLRQVLPTCVSSVSARELQQWLNHSPVTTLWKIVPSTRDVTDKPRIHLTLHHTSTWGWGWTEDEFGDTKSFPAAMPLDGSRDRSLIYQQLVLEKQEMILTFRFHQWRREMSQHIWAKQPYGAAGSKGIAAAWIWEGVQVFDTAQASRVELFGCLD